MPSFDKSREVVGSDAPRHPPRVPPIRAAGTDQRLSGGQFHKSELSGIYSLKVQNTKM
jgi:hypothetical protein